MRTICARLPLALVLVLSTVGVAHAAPCSYKVNKLTGSDKGTLNHLAAQGCSPIEFSADLAGKTVIVPESATLKQGVRVQSLTFEQPITITGLDSVVNIFTLVGNNELNNLTIVPSNGVNHAAALVKGNKNVITKCALQSGQVGALVDAGTGNLITDNRFTGLAKHAIRLINNGNLALEPPANFGAVQNNEFAWTLAGDVPPGTVAVEVYAHDLSAVLLPPQGAQLLGTSTKFTPDGRFTIAFGITEVDKSTPLTALAFDSGKNTSAFSLIFVPTSDPGFFSIVDPDGDGIENWNDNCPENKNPAQEDGDVDGVGDVCDNCPTIPSTDQTDTDSDALGDACDTDIDADGVPNTPPKDNCPFDSNADQLDGDSDGLGDVCELDQNNDNDEDGTADPDDNCPTLANPQQEDTDSDGLGNVCDEDIDNDGVKQDVLPGDNCAFAPNPDQADADQDGTGDACEGNSQDGDDGAADDNGSDGADGVQPDENADTGADSDGDGLSDALDNCPTVFNAAQADPDGDLLGNECDVDDDGDGFADVVEGDLDLDGDSVPNRLDSDSNGDGVPDKDAVADIDANGVPDYLQPDLIAPFAHSINQGGCALVLEGKV